jgi:hypothetical protein
MVDHPQQVINQQSALPFQIPWYYCGKQYAFSVLGYWQQNERSKH